MLTWAPYKPSSAAPWNLQRVVHLHRRAGFAATWPEIQRDLERRARGRRLPPPLRPDPIRRRSARIRVPLRRHRPGRRRLRQPRAPQGLVALPLLFSPDPLRERLTLMWHNHFATSNLKVDDLTPMKRQNETLRQLARAPFGDLLRSMAHDPALLVWLDAPPTARAIPTKTSPAS